MVEPITTALLIGGAALSGISKAGQLFGPGRRQQKREFKFQKARARAAIESTRRFIQERQEEDPREQALLKQSLFGRGLGKSTIAEQDMGRLTRHQARRMAALQSQLVLQERGLALLRRSRKAQRWGRYFQAAGDIGQTALALGSSGISGGGGGGGGGDTSFSYAPNPDYGRPAYGAPAYYTQAYA